MCMCMCVCVINHRRRRRRRGEYSGLNGIKKISHHRSTFPRSASISAGKTSREMALDTSNTLSFWLMMPVTRPEYMHSMRRSSSFRISVKPSCCWRRSYWSRLFRWDSETTVSIRSFVTASLEAAGMVPSAMAAW